MQVTGLDKNTSTFKAIVGSFKALKEFADFDAAAGEDHDDHAGDDQEASINRVLGGVNLGYTINLHLPATSDVAVFNAIFKSLREHLLT